MCTDPGAALVEGYPFGPPPSAVLVSTRRTARYLQLEAAVGGAVSAAYGEAPRDAAAAAGDEAREVAGLPSLLEVMELVGGQVRAAAGPTAPPCAPPLPCIHNMPRWRKSWLCQEKE